MCELVSNRVQTMFVDGLDGLQHVLPVELPLQWVHSLTVSQPSVQVQVPTLHQHINVAVCYFTAIIHITNPQQRRKKYKRNHIYKPTTTTTAIPHT